MSLLGAGCTMGKPCRYSSFSMMDYLSCYLHQHFEVSDFTGGEGQAGTERVTMLEQNQQKTHTSPSVFSLCHSHSTVTSTVLALASTKHISWETTITQGLQYRRMRWRKRRRRWAFYPASIRLPCGNGCLEDISEAAKACRISLWNGTLNRGLSSWC